MSNERRQLATFAASESGAVTVDWVVLTGGLVGLGMAVMGVVSGGVEQMSRAISTALTDVQIETRFAEALQNLGFAALDFTGDLGGFNGGTLTNLPGIGDVLQIGPNETASVSFGLPNGAAQAVVEFDLMGLDSLNGESATITLNGEVAGTVTVDNGNATFYPADNGSTSFEAFNSSQGSDLNGNGAPDSVTQIRMTVGNPGDSLDLQIHSGAGAGVENESYAIDNVSVSAT